MMKKYLPYLVLALVFVASYQFCFDSKLDLNGDNASYIQLARTLSEGHGYSNASPSGFTPASHFPPGYPVFLSFFMMLGIDNLIFFKILNGILLCLSLMMLFGLSRRLSGQPAVALTAMLLACLSPHLLHFASMAMSEMLYLICTVAAFVALYLYSAGKPVAFYRSPWFYVAIVTAVAAYYVRTVGASILFAVVLFFLFRKEWRASVASVGGIVLLLLPWSLRNAAYGIESRYFGTIMTVNPWRPEMGTVSSVGEMMSKMVTNFDETVLKGFREILFPFLTIDYAHPSGFAGWVAGLLVLAVIVYGCWVLGGKNLRFPFLGFLLANIGLFALWHGGNGSRYVVPVAPFLYLFFYYGVYNLVVLVGRYFFKMSLDKVLLGRWVYVLLLLAIPVMKPLSAQSDAARRPFPPAYRNYFELAKAMERQLPAGTVVACRKPELYSYFAPSHFPERYLFSQNPDDVVKDLCKKKVDYVILEQLGFSSTPLYLYPAIQKNPELFPVVSRLPAPDTYLLKFDRRAAAAKFSLAEEE